MAKMENARRILRRRCKKRRTVLEGFGPWAGYLYVVSLIVGREKELELRVGVSSWRVVNDAKGFNH